MPVLRAPRAQPEPRGLRALSGRKDRKAKPERKALPDLPDPKDCKGR